MTTLVLCELAGPVDADVIETVTGVVDAVDDVGIVTEPDEPAGVVIDDVEEGTDVEVVEMLEVEAGVEPDVEVGVVEPLPDVTLEVEAGVEPDVEVGVVEPLPDPL